MKPEEWFKENPLRRVAKEEPAPFTCPKCKSGPIPYERKTATFERIGGAVWSRAMCRCEQEQATRDAERARAQKDEARRAGLAVRMRAIREECGLSGALLSRSFDAFQWDKASPSMRRTGEGMQVWAQSYPVLGPDDRARGFVLSSAQSPMKCGIGKTHLLVAAVLELISQGIPATFATSGQVLDSMRADYSKGRAGDTLARLSKITVLAIDDLGTERIAEDGRGDWVREQLFNLLDAREKARLPLLVSTNCSEGAIREHIDGSRGEHGERIVSRLRALATWVNVYESRDFRGEDTSAL